MKTLYKELEEEIIKEEEKRGKSIPSSVKSRIKMCSDKLLYAKTEEDVDKILQDYHLSSVSIGKDVSWPASKVFDKFIKDMKSKFR